MEKNLSDDLVLFFSKFSVMLSNGIPLIKTLENLEKESTNEILSQALKQIINGFNSDKSKHLSDLMQQFPNIFDKHIIRLIKVGEEIGLLDLISGNIPEYILFSRLEEWKKG